MIAPFVLLFLPLRCGTIVRPDLRVGKCHIVKLKSVKHFSFISTLRGAAPFCLMPALLFRRCCFFERNQKLNCAHPYVDLPHARIITVLIVVTTFEIATHKI